MPSIAARDGKLRYKAPMSRWLEIALTLVVFGVVMLALSAAVNAVVPGVQTWLVEQVGHGGVWILLALIIGGSALYAWRDHRRAGDKAKGSGT